MEESIIAMFYFHIPSFLLWLKARLFTFYFEAEIGGSIPPGIESSQTEPLLFWIDYTIQNLNILVSEVQMPISRSEGYSFDRPINWWYSNVITLVIAVIGWATMLIYGFAFKEVSGSQICFYIIISFPAMILVIGGLIVNITMLKVQISDDGITNPHRNIYDICYNRKKLLYWSDIQKVWFVHENSNTSQIEDEYVEYSFVLFSKHGVMGYKINEFINIKLLTQIIQQYCEANGIVIE